MGAGSVGEGLIVLEGRGLGSNVLLMGRPDRRNIAMPVRQRLRAGLSDHI